MNIFSRLIAASAMCLSIAAHAEVLSVGDLSGSDCYHFDSQSQADENGYWRRHPPYVGYKKGEHLLAGGDGTCVLGFPVVGRKKALVLVDGRKIPVYLQPVKHQEHQTYISADHAVRVNLTVTGSETTCKPDADNCCGDYTFVTLNISKGQRRAVIKAVTYSGG